MSCNALLSNAWWLSLPSFEWDYRTIKDDSALSHVQHQPSMMTNISGYKETTTNATITHFDLPWQTLES